ncbi:MAG TPA: DUF6687 family protein [Acidimicrobiales bacterium]|nr:DUF6687 family protein [Acidimicrobiales bacterium]
MSTFRYLPAHHLAGRAHVIIDGASRPGTAYTLSHWPHTPTPRELDADLSTEIVRNALRHPERLPAQVDLVSIDHYDVDGVVALALAVVDGLESEYGPLLVGAARVGDFDVVTDRHAALIAFTLNALDDPERSTGPGASALSGPRDPLEHCGARAAKAMGILFELAGDPERFEAWWREEWDAYDSSVRALADGRAAIEEDPALDLAVVRVDPGVTADGRAAWGSATLHRAAVHSATTCLRVATVAPGRMEFHYRYESWVRLTSRRPRRRVDLERLAHELTAAETAACRWAFDGAGSVSGSLHPIGDAASTIEPERFVELVRGELATLDDGPAAWDPYPPTPHRH